MCLDKKIDIKSCCDSRSYEQRNAYLVLNKNGIIIKCKSCKSIEVSIINGTTIICNVCNLIQNLTK